MELELFPTIILPMKVSSLSLPFHAHSFRRKHSQMISLLRQPKPGLPFFEKAEVDDQALKGME
jgi:hypothetical protein